MATIPQNVPVGTDDHVPLIDTGFDWKIWAMHQMYVGKEGQGKYVGKVGDWVVDTLAGTFYRITAITETTCIPTFVAQNVVYQVPAPDIHSSVFGIGPGDQCDTQYAYFDDSVVPHSLITDSFVRVAGVSNSYARIFRGVDISATGSCISRLYSQNGTVVDDKIPLELAQSDNMNTTALYGVAPCQTTTMLTNGEKVTLVVYNNLGSPMFVRQLIVVKSAFARAVNASRKLIVNTSLKSPFVSTSDPEVIQYPVNVPLTGLNLMGVVHYSDGSTQEYPVNGSKFAITGYEHFAATKVGETFQTVLHYYPSDDEYSYVLSDGPKRHISKIFTCKVTRAEGSYNIKLFGYPKWNAADQSYRFRWFVINAERTLLRDVTSVVRLNENIAGFDPRLYGVVQRVIASVYFDEIVPTWRHVKFVQPMTVTLFNPSKNYAGTDWALSFNPDNTPLYGMDCHARMSQTLAGQWTLNLTSECTSQEQWLTKFYYNTLPLRDVFTETTPPTPTHFVVLTAAGSEFEFPLSRWNSTLTISSSLSLSETLMVKFIKRTVSQNDIYLSIAGVPVYPAL